MWVCGVSSLTWLLNGWQRDILADLLILCKFNLLRGCICGLSKLTEGTSSRVVWKWQHTVTFRLPFGGRNCWYQFNCGSLYPTIILDSLYVLFLLGRTCLKTNNILPDTWKTLSDIWNKIFSDILNNTLTYIWDSLMSDI